MKRVLLILALAAHSGVSLAEFGETLIGGREAGFDEYPELVYISVNDGKALCSATIIGPRVVMTAAHCATGSGDISNSGIGAFVIVGREVFKAHCEQSSLYASEDHDMALCKTDRDLKVRYASIADHGPKLNEIVTLSGFGCIKSPGSGGNDGKLRVGEAPVILLESKGYHWFRTSGNSALCFGDSGGPAFLQIKAPKSEHHYVIGVNSRGDIKTDSLLTALYEKASQEFFADWADRNQVEICGINKDCGPGEPPAPQKCEEALGEFSKAMSNLDLRAKDLERCVANFARLPFSAY